MADKHLHIVVQHLRNLAHGRAENTLPDRDLLDRFVAIRDETAFTALVERHGSMVLAVCRRVLRNTHNADDAYQATFLVLARKAGSIRKKEAIGSWLHGVAYQVAMNLRRDLARRVSHEVSLGEATVAGADENLTWREVQVALDEELARLPERYRAPLVLCYLEGRTRDEAAELLGWSSGSLRGRLDRGRELLRARLIRRGFGLSAALLASALGVEVGAVTVPASLVVSTVQAASLAGTGQATSGVISAKVMALTNGVMKSMLMTKLKTTIVLLGALSTVAIGLGRSAFQGFAQQPANENKGQPIQLAAQKPALPAPRKDATETDKDKLQGTWTFVAIELEGRDVSEQFLNGIFKGAEVVINEDKIVLRNAAYDFGGKFTLDTSTNPKIIDFSSLFKEVEEVLQIRQSEGIYELRGGTLRICATVEHKVVKKRPNEFKTKAGSQLILIVLKRKPEQQNGPAQPDEAKVSKRPKVEFVEGVKQDLANLQGQWEITSWVYSGSTILPRKGYSGKFVIEGNKAILIHDAQEARMTWLIDPTKTPKALDICYEQSLAGGKVREGEDVFDGKVGPAIYELEGDTLMTCSVDPGRQRPSRFSSPPKIKRSLMILQRIKP